MPESLERRNAKLELEKPLKRCGTWGTFKLALVDGNACGPRQHNALTTSFRVVPRMNQNNHSCEHDQGR